MRRGIASIAGGAFLLAVAVVLAAEPAAKDAAPWHLSKITTTDRDRLGPEAEKTDGPPTFLHLQLRFDPAVAQRKMHTFRVVNRRGQTVGELSGRYEDRSLLIFEKDEAWDSLVGLYLDGLNHREPLFGTRPVAPKPPPAPAPAPTLTPPPPTATRVSTPSPTTWVPSTMTRVPSRITSLVPGARSTRVRVSRTTCVDWGIRTRWTGPSTIRVVSGASTTCVVTRGTTVVVRGT